MIISKHIHSLLVIILLITTQRSAPISKHVIRGGIIAGVIAAEAAVLSVARQGFMLDESAFGFKLGLLMGADVNHRFTTELIEKEGKLRERGVELKDLFINREKPLWLNLTPLMIAAIENKEKLVDMLIAHKADVNIQEKRLGYTALHFALLNKNSRIAFKLQSAGAKDIAAKDGMTPFGLSVINEMKKENIQNPEDTFLWQAREAVLKMTPEKREALGKQLDETIEKARIQQGL